MAASAPSNNATPTAPSGVPWKPQTMHSDRPRVLILGAGFAGMNAANELSKLPVDVTLVDRRNHHTFQPLLYQVALAVLSPANIAQSIRTMMRNKPNVEVLMDEAVGFDLAKQQVRMKSRALLEYDYLLVATGSTHSYFGKDEWAKYAPGLKTIEDATEIRRRVLLAFELAERQMLETGSHPPLNFVIVGGGPTGVELAGAISDIARLYMRHDFRHIDPAKSRVTILEGSPRILSTYPEDLSRKAVEQLKGLDVEVRTGAHVTDIQPGYVMVGDQRIDSVVTLWAAGVQASPLGKLLGVETDRRGCVLVNEFLNPPGHPEIFVCGDLAHVEEGGHQIPGVAQPAMQMGTHVARMIKQDTENKPRTKFHYFDKGDMATIGRLAAVAKIEWPFKAHWAGFPAWLTWLVVHIYFLIGFRNRIFVVLEWAYTYFTFTRGARLITGDQQLPGWTEQQGIEPVVGGALDINSPGAHAHAAPVPEQLPSAAGKS
jgi:NADH:ubiquinone reductase (H+-translocating)